MENEEESPGKFSGIEKAIQKGDVSTRRGAVKADFDDDMIFQSGISARLSIGGRDIAFDSYTAGDIHETVSAEVVASDVLLDPRQENYLLPPGKSLPSELETSSLLATESILEVEKRSESGSTDSEPQKGSVVDANFFVKTMVNPETAGLFFAVSALRPDTYLGRQQGAHITAYIVFVTAILETVDEQNIADIPGLLVAAAMQFAPFSQWDHFNEALRELIEKNPFFEKSKRKQLTAGLRETEQEATVQFIKKSVKIHYAAVLAHFIDDLSNQILMAINQSESTLYARAGRAKTRQELGQEGARIRNAMKDLRKIVSDISPEPAASLIEQSSVADSDKTTENVGEDKMLTLSSNMRSRAPNSSSSSVDLSGAIASHIFDLFDFDYYEYTSSAILGKIESSVLEEMKELEKLLPRSKKGKRLTADQIAERSQITEKIQCCKDILQVLGEIEDMENPKERYEELIRIQDDEVLNELLQTLDMNDMGTQVDKVLESIRDKAPGIIAQHLDIVINHAFPGLQNLSEREWDHACVEFNTMVEERFHWDQMPGVMEDARDFQPKHPKVSATKVVSQEERVDGKSSCNSFGNP
ncbi:MAG: hypothetical protein KBB94_09700 [Legionellaceae bacterium]|nr:hypothetical protein [Legionellaceae bacterium]MBP9775630.1 hypothetical protein [Legionellaceae bacterium]